MIEQQT